MRYISLFSGIEAASVAWEPLGWEPLAFCEIDEFPSAVLAHRFPDVENLGDITKVDWKEVIARHGRPDVVVGGSPCQSFSVAGGRESLSGESRLMFEYVRALDEIRPRWFLWENVPGVLNTRDNAFAQLLGEVQKLGYGSLAWRVLDAQFFGVAQRRRRVFLVGRLGEGGSAAAVLFEPESLRGDNPSSREKRKALTAAARDGVEAASAAFKFHQGSGAGEVGYGEEQSPTLTTDWYQQAVLTPWDVQTMHQNADGDVHVTDDMTGTITAQSSVSRQQIVCISSGQANAEVREDGGAPALTCLHESPIVAMADDNAKAAIDDDMCGTPKVGGAPPLVASVTDKTSQDQTLFDGTGTGYVVRRLTPVECERLQGFPSGWTDVPYKGKEHPSDTPRYKACGNSMAVPVMRWIGSRIQMVDEMEGASNEHHRRAEGDCSKDRMCERTLREALSR